ncbi:MAG TPA: UvrD-helicase domain-containing protein [Chitinophagaceae bacterium]|nr:UvrD-helicase domain-containing protein [Chitinophagaceae bacterium]
MEFRIADTFTASLARLTGEEQRAVKTTAFDLQMNPASPGLSFHKLDRARDKNFWSFRVNRDIRLIVHRSESSLLLCYVDHHDKAYEWAERRKLEVHPKTGAAQLVEIRETVQEVMVPVYVKEEATIKELQKKLFERIPDETLLAYGVPPEWLNDAREATEDTLFALVDHLPGEAAEALLELATGGKPAAPQQADTTGDPFAHPDAQRRFRTMNNVDELERALDFPWEKWAVFLHPAQRQWVEKSYSGPARVSGSAGTGKTIVALHRAVYLSKSHPDARVLLTTFSPLLANSLHVRLRSLVSNQPRLAERIDVCPLTELGLRLYKTRHSAPEILSKATLTKFMTEASKSVEGHRFSLSFLLAEYEQVVDTWQLKTWEDYRDVKRLGRKTRLPEPQRALLWSIFEKVNQRLIESSLLTVSGLFHRLSESIAADGRHPYDFIVVDEAQDISVAQLRFLATLSTSDPNALFFAGDTGQRIFQQAFSWKAAGVDVRGRSRMLNVNYRTSHQIRQKTDLLLGPEVVDGDGIQEERGRTVSVFNGPQPQVETFDSTEEECNRVRFWVKEQLAQRVAPHEIGVFVRSDAEILRALAALQGVSVPFCVLDERVEVLSGTIAVSTMHFAKGLEFRSVAVMACDDEIIPSQERIESITDSADLDEVYKTERHLLYVACTRARDCLLITGVKPGSEFLGDLRILS